MAYCDMTTDNGGGWMASFVVKNTGDGGVNYFPRLAGNPNASVGAFPKTIAAPAGDYDGPSLATRWSIYNAYTDGDRQYRATSYDSTNKPLLDIMFEGAQAVEDSKSIRSIALYDKIPYFTTAAAASAASLAIREQARGDVSVKALQG